MSRIALLAPIVPVLAAAVLTSAAGGPALGQTYDPYGPPAPAWTPPRDRSAVTPFIGMFDGTPRYELFATTSGRSDAAQSGLLAINLQDMLPVDAGKDSPLTTGEHEGNAILFDYLVKYWQTYPTAKDREGHVPHLGFAHPFETFPVDGEAPPAAVRAELERQANILFGALMAHPWMERSEGVHVSPYIRYRRDRDASGTPVWGFQLNIYFPVFAPRGPQRPDGRWDGEHLEGPAIVVCSNCVSAILTPTGRYRGLQSMGVLRVLVDSITAPVWVSQYRSGQGPLIANPGMFDPARPQTDIQILTVESPSLGIGVAANVAPDRPQARLIAATWLTDWRGLVDQINSPGAPRAD